MINYSLCVHTASLHHQTHVPPWSLSHLWVNLGVIALLSWMPCFNKHICRNRHIQEARSCLPGLHMQIKRSHYGTQCKNPLPSTFLPFNIVITCSICGCEMKSRPLGLFFQADQNSQWCRTSPEYFGTDAQDWKHVLSQLPAFVSYFLGGIQKQFNICWGTEKSSNEVIDFRQSCV